MAIRSTDACRWFLCVLVATERRVHRSAVGYLTEALERRYVAGDKPFTVMSCDNIQCNGDMLSGLVQQFAAAKGGH